MDIRILVAAHKPYWMPDDDVYLPIQVGAAGKESLGWQRDDEGDNISEKNPNYCELTALYWAWKNLDADYIGLCHYRRYFSRRSHTGNTEKKKSSILHRADYETLLKKFDIILPQKRNYYIETVRSQYEHAHHKDDLVQTEKLIQEMYPEYKQAFECIMARRRLYIANMFVMKKKDLHAYCSWLFPLLETLEGRISLKRRNVYEARAFGFLAERLFNVWLETQMLNVYESNVVFLEHINWIKKGMQFLERKFIVNNK